MSREIPVTNEIQAFFHCVLCTQEERPQWIEAGYTVLGFQVWCRNHNCNIIHFDFEGQKHPAATSRWLAPSHEGLHEVKDD